MADAHGHKDSPSFPCSCGECTFESVLPAKSSRRKKTGPAGDESPIVAALKQELQQTGQHLQSTIERGDEDLAGRAQIGQRGASIDR